MGYQYFIKYGGARARGTGMAPGSCSFSLQSALGGLNLEPTRAGIESGLRRNPHLPNTTAVYFWQLSLTILTSVTRRWFPCEVSPDELSPLPLDFCEGVPVTVTVCPTWSPSLTVLL